MKAVSGAWQRGAAARGTAARQHGVSVALSSGARQRGAFGTTG